MSEQAIRPDAVPVRRLDARNRKFPGRTLIAGPQQALELDETAALIWRSIDGRRTVHQLAERVASEYAVDVDVVTTDVWELLMTLADCEVIDL